MNTFEDQLSVQPPMGRVLNTWALPIRSDQPDTNSKSGEFLTHPTKSETTFLKLFLVKCEGPPSDMAHAVPVMYAPAVAPISPLVVQPGLGSSLAAALSATCFGPLQCRTRTGQCCPLVFNGLRIICPYIC